MRSDGRKVKPDEPMYYLIPYFLTHRYDAMNMITVDVPEEPLRQYMNVLPIQAIGKRRNRSKRRCMLSRFRLSMKVNIPMRSC